MALTIILIFLLPFIVHVCFDILNDCLKKHKKKQYSSFSEADFVRTKQATIETARKRYMNRINGISNPVEDKVPMYSHLARFLNAVKLTRESDGLCIINLKRNGRKKTVSLNAVYCNNSHVDCMDELLYDGALDYLGMTMGENGESFEYNMDNIDDDGYSFSIRYLMKEISERMPDVKIWPNVEKQNYICVTFRT